MMHYQKISIFGMTEYDKMLWMDMDVNVQKNFDEVFDQYDLKEGDQIWGQHDNWSCQDKQADKEFCSGVMLFKPKKDHVSGFMKQAKDMGYCWGDQKLIARYFSNSSSTRSKQLLP